MKSGKFMDLTFRLLAKCGIGAIVLTTESVTLTTSKAKARTGSSRIYLRNNKKWSSSGPYLGDVLVCITSTPKMLPL